MQTSHNLTVSFFSLLDSSRLSTPTCTVEQHLEGPGRRKEKKVYQFYDECLGLHCELKIIKAKGGCQNGVGSRRRHETGAARARDRTDANLMKCF